MNWFFPHAKCQQSTWDWRLQLKGILSQCHHGSLPPHITVLSTSQSIWSHINCTVWMQHMGGTIHLATDLVVYMSVLYVTAWTIFQTHQTWTAYWNGNLMLTGEVQRNGTVPICSVYQCSLSIPLSLPLSYSIALIGFQHWPMLSSNMWAAGQSSAPCQSGEFNIDIWKTEAHLWLNMNHKRGE